jgi:leader peptidase (prepilin peptidase) / N-methyltransferase
MIRVLATSFAALAGLAFGSFLNVCLTRWPQGESVITPRSHCRSCKRTLAWWENVPLVSWLLLGGRCRTCRAWIGWRYPLVELAMGALWAFAVWRFPGWDPAFDNWAGGLSHTLVVLLGQLLFYWLLVALAALDAEQLWLPDWLTLPGISLGIVFTLVRAYFDSRSPINDMLEPAHIAVVHAALTMALSILVAAGLILVIRGIYWLIRRREGIGLGDAKLMAMLAAWLGFSRAILAFGLGVVLGAVAALVFLALPSTRQSEAHWSAAKLPLGTFLCIGGIVASLWGNALIAAYLHWAGFH